MKNTINLLSFAAGPLGFWEKFYIWALSIGRYIIIITELLVLVCFFYKFKVDNDFAALKQDFNQNLSVAKNNYAIEQNIVKYQKQIGIEGQLINDQVQTYPVLSNILQLIPSDITITDFRLVNNQTLTMNGSTTSPLSEVQNMANTFKSNTTYTNVALSDVNEDNTTKITSFTLTAHIDQPSS